MPTVVRDGEFEFIIRAREFPFEPPHVHVRFGGGEVRIRLGDGAFLDRPPAGKRRAMLEAFTRHKGRIRRTWERIHGPIEEGQK